MYSGVYTYILYLPSGSSPLWSGPNHWRRGLPSGVAEIPSLERKANPPQQCSMLQSCPITLYPLPSPFRPMIPSSPFMVKVTRALFQGTSSQCDKSSKSRGGPHQWLSMQNCWGTSDISVGGHLTIFFMTWTVHGPGIWILNTLQSGYRLHIDDRRLWCKYQWSEAAARINVRKLMPLIGLLSSTEKMVTLGQLHFH